MAAMVAMRWFIAGVSFVLAIALISRGDVLIGGLLLVLAVARMAMFIRMQQRREQFRARRRRWRDGP